MDLCAVLSRGLGTMVLRETRVRRPLLAVLLPGTKLLTSLILSRLFLSFCPFLIIYIVRWKKQIRDEITALS